MKFNWKHYFESRIIDRGYMYYKLGNVEAFKHSKNKITAHVKGTKYYQVEISFDDNKITNYYCTCPYAAEGTMCKHMAAVLYFNDLHITETAVVVGDTPLLNIEEENISKLISKAPRRKIDLFLLELAGANEEIAQLVKMNFPYNNYVSSYNNLQQDIDEAFDEFISCNYYYESEEDLYRFLLDLIEHDIKLLIKNDLLLASLGLINYIVIKIADIDTCYLEGNLLDIGRYCYASWKSIYDKGPDKLKKEMADWMRQNVKDRNPSNNSITDAIFEFLFYEVKDEYFLKEELKRLDEKISRNNTYRWEYSPKYFSCEKTSNVAMRIKIMRYLGLDKTSIDNYLKENWKYENIRAYAYDKAMENKDYITAISILNESKQIDNISMTLNYCDKLIDIYRIINDKEKEKTELLYYLINAITLEISKYDRLKSLSKSSQWINIRNEIIPTYDSKSRCILFAKEKMTDALLKEVEQSGKINLLDKYSGLLMNEHKDLVFQMYKTHVLKYAVDSRNTSSYNDLISYLNKMVQVCGSKSPVIELANSLKKEYPTRKVMVKMLTEFIED